MQKTKYSERDSRGKIYIDCSECNRGGNGTDPDLCSCGWKTKKPMKGGCFIGELLPGLEIE
jgi:hypothetical protein